MRSCSSLACLLLLACQPDVGASSAAAVYGEDGRTELSFEIPSRARGYIRLRATATSRKRPIPGPDGPKLFQTSAILLDAP